MRKILLCALLIVTTYALATFLQQISPLGKKENIDISKIIQNFVNSHSYIVEALKVNKLSEDEKTILPLREEKLANGTFSEENIGNEPQAKIFNESTCKEIVLDYFKKSLYVSDVNSYQSIGRGNIATKDYFAFHFYNNDMYLISYYVDNNFRIFYRDIFSDELRQAGTESLYRNISLNFDNSNKINKQNIIDFVNKSLGNMDSKYEINYGGNYNVNTREMVYLYYYNDDNNIMEIYYDCNNQQLYTMTEILQPILGY
jgi:hypothetical protein